MFVYLDVSEMQSITYRPEEKSLQARKKEVQKYLIFEAKLSINVKTKKYFRI